MAAAPRRALRLTRDLVDKGKAFFPQGTAGAVLANRRVATEADHLAMAAELLREAPENGIWVFAYGSLIWNPEFDFIDWRKGQASGWHRAFRLGYDYWYRGSVERPGLMLVLDRGGSCNGMLFRLPDAAVEANLLALLRREVRLVPHAFPPRWIKVRSGGNRLPAISFVLNRRGPAYVPGLSHSDLMRILATASGSLGSMAEYLRNTVEHLEAEGLNDRLLWRLQEQVAEFLEAAEQPG